MKNPKEIEVNVECTKKGNLLVKIILDGEHLRGVEAMEAFAAYIARDDALIIRRSGGATHEEE